MQTRNTYTLLDADSQTHLPSPVRDPKAFADMLRNSVSDFFLSALPFLVKKHAICACRMPPNSSARGPLQVLRKR